MLCYSCKWAFSQLKERKPKWRFALFRLVSPNPSPPSPLPHAPFNASPVDRMDRRVTLCVYALSCTNWTQSNNPTPHPSTCLCTKLYYVDLLNSRTGMLTHTGMLSDTGIWQRTHKGLWHTLSMLRCNASSTAHQSVAVTYHVENCGRHASLITIRLR